MADNDSGILKESQKKTALGEKSRPMFPGDFKITRLRLLSPIRGFSSPIDLNTENSSWTELKFFEDIYSPSVSGELIIQEGVGLIESTPIIGEETIEITFSTSGAVPTPVGVEGQTDFDVPVSEQSKIITNRFRVYKVDPPIKVNDNFRSIKLYFVSDIAVTNMMVKVQKNYPTSQLIDVKKPENPAEDKTYTIADMVRDIYYDCFIGKKKPNNHKPTTKNLLVEPTRGRYYASIPNWSPFKAINFLTTRALAGNNISSGANFVFYETLKGFRFISIETLMLGGFRGYKLLDPEQSKFNHYKNFPSEVSAKSGDKQSFIPVYDTAEYVPVDSSNPSEKPYVAVYTYRPGNISGISTQEKYYSVSNFELLHNFDTLKNLGLGMYANKVITHDIMRMSWNEIDYHYVKPSEIQIFEDPQSGVVTETQNTDVTRNDIEILEDTSIKSDPGKVCSNGADMLGRAESHISLFPTNRGSYVRYSEGVRKTTYVDNSGELRVGVNYTTQTPNGSSSESTPKETEKNVEEWLAQRISQRRLLDTVKLQFTVPGDSAREVGDLIWFHYPSENPDTPKISGYAEPHKYFSGKYLITALMHKVTKTEYTMTVEAIKDGYRSQISPGFGLNNPRTLDPTGVTDAE